jgi:hypothetical protein
MNVIPGLRLTVRKEHFQASGMTEGGAMPLRNLFDSVQVGTMNDES